jgi:hypothetical protein
VAGIKTINIQLINNLGIAPMSETMTIFSFGVPLAINSLTANLTAARMPNFSAPRTPCIYVIGF